MEAIAKSELENKLMTLIESSIAPHGFRVVDLDCHVARRSVLRIFIEQTPQSEGFGRATVDDCEKVSRMVGPLLDVEEIIPGAYDLEVSSPGLDRRLRTSSDFSQALGNEVKLKLRERIEGVGANPRGSLKQVNGDSLLLEVSGADVTIPFSGIRRANLIWDAQAGSSQKGNVK